MERLQKKRKKTQLFMASLEKIYSILGSLSYVFSFGHIQHLAREAPFRNVKRKVWGVGIFFAGFFWP